MILPAELKRNILNMEVYFFQPLPDIEARAGLADPGEVAVPDDLGFRIVGAEALQ